MLINVVDMQIFIGDGKCFSKLKCKQFLRLYFLVIKNFKNNATQFDLQ